MIPTLMAAETAEAPAVVARLLADAERLEPVLHAIARKRPDVALVCARGSSGHAGVLLRYLIETRLGIPVSAVAPSVFSTFHSPMSLGGALFVAISQSGGSPDLLAAAHAARAGGALTLAMVNVETSPLAEAAEHVLPLRAGPERSVAATKSVVAAMALSALLVARAAGDAALLEALARLPRRLEAALGLDWSRWGAALADAPVSFAAGRGFGYAPAREIALKVTETLGRPALAYSAAELRHGPRAALDARTPVLLLEVADETAGDVAILAADLAGDGVPVFHCGGGGRRDEGRALPWIDADHPVTDAVAMLPPAYLALERAARALGRDPDRPPHLSKVTRTL